MEIAASGPKPWTRLVPVVIAAVALIGVAGATWAYVLRAGHAEVVQDHGEDDNLVVAAKSAVETRMPDAQSIAFGKVFVHRIGTLPSVCGRVDIVEEEDSFSGEERFVFSEGELMLEEIGGTAALDQKWGVVCVDD